MCWGGWALCRAEGELLAAGAFGGVGAEEGEFVADGVAEVGDVEVGAVVGAEAWGAFVGAAGGEAGGVEAADEGLSVGLEGVHGAVGGGGGLAVEGVLQVDGGGVFRGG